MLCAEMRVDTERDTYTRAHDAISQNQLDNKPGGGRERCGNDRINIHTLNDTDSIQHIHVFLAE